MGTSQRFISLQFWGHTVYQILHSHTTFFEGTQILSQAHKSPQALWHSTLHRHKTPPHRHAITKEKPSPIGTHIHDVDKFLGRTHKRYMEPVSIRQLSLGPDNCGFSPDHTGPHTGKKKCTISYFLYREGASKDSGTYLQAVLWEVPQAPTLNRRRSNADFLCLGEKPSVVSGKPTWAGRQLDWAPKVNFPEPKALFTSTSTRVAQYPRGLLHTKLASGTTTGNFLPQLG